MERSALLCKAKDEFSLTMGKFLLRIHEENHPGKEEQM